MQIEIVPEGGGVYRVKVSGATATEHLVTVREEYRMKLGGEETNTEALLRESFAFLLDRESNTSILSRFDLSVIQRYFPEYERTMRAKFGV